jgi:hypothetical protein
MRPWITGYHEHPSGETPGLGIRMAKKTWEYHGEKNRFIYWKMLEDQPIIDRDGFFRKQGVHQ